MESDSRVGLRLVGFLSRDLHLVTLLPIVMVVLVTSLLSALVLLLLLTKLLVLLTLLLPLSTMSLPSTHQILGMITKTMMFLPLMTMTL